MFWCVCLCAVCVSVLILCRGRFRAVKLRVLFLSRTRLFFISFKFFASKSRLRSVAGKRWRGAGNAQSGGRRVGERAMMESTRKLVLLAILLLAVARTDGRRVKEDEQQTTELAFAVSGTIDNFAPSRFPNGILKGTYVIGGPSNSAGPCGGGQSMYAGLCGGEQPTSTNAVVSAPGVNAEPGNGILIAGDGQQDDPVDEIHFTQAKNNMAAAELSVVPIDLRKIDLALDHSDRIKEELDEKIARIRQSNRRLEETLRTIVEEPDRPGPTGPPGEQGYPGPPGARGQPGKAVPGERPHPVREA